MEGARVAQALADLHAWLDTMRQPGGYAGPVVHWWRDCHLYTGPGLDWRYEGILAGYRLLYEKTGSVVYRDRLRAAVADLTAGRDARGSYRGSRFEENPGRLGTPHEAAAVLGLLRALPHVADVEACLEMAGRTLDHLIDRLWDVRAGGFDDRPGVAARVPSRLATLAETLISYAEARGEPAYLSFARAALGDVLRHQAHSGRWAGAVHRYAGRDGHGDGRFSPYDNARCVPALLAGSRVFGTCGYRDAAFEVLDFLRRTMNPDGSWPQLVYENGRRVHGPRWIAGSADILYAFHVLGMQLPEAALERLLRGQLRSGGLRTAAGFRDRLAGRRSPADLTDHRDLLPVVGWNDKPFRLLAEVLPVASRLPAPAVGPVELACVVGRRPATFHETETEFYITAARGPILYRWVKSEPWAAAIRPEVVAG